MREVVLGLTTIERAAITRLCRRIGFSFGFAVGRQYVDEMPQDDDTALLRLFVAEKSETAFTELVRRNLDMVYSAALRRVRGDSMLAQDIAQSVFTDLARKAKRLPPKVILAAWLHRATKLASAAALRAEARRSAREQRALAMREPDGAESLPDWDALRPLLDDALDRLRDGDRQALLLRYFRQFSLRQVGSLLGISEDAARMRVERAVQRLRHVLVSRGIASTAQALAVAMSAHAVEAAPARMATAVAAAALTCAASAPATALPLQLVRFMATTKLKAVLVLALAAAGTTIVLQHRNNEEMQSEVARLRAAVERPTPPPTIVRHPQAEAGLSNQRFMELLRLRGQVGVMRHQIEELKARLGQRVAAQAAAQDVGPGSANPSPNRYYPVGSWTNFGYQTPEATALTLFWALRSRDQAAYGGALGKEMPPIAGPWADAFQQVQGAYISAAEQSPDGSLMVSAEFEMDDGSTVNSIATFRQANGQWVIHSLAGFPIELSTSSQPATGTPQYSLPAGN